jgi:choline dehydrogenase-like flavoprotein/pimeloyl-ACP methyl ester carboxylesterase
MTTNSTDYSRSRTDRKASWLSLGFEDLVRSIGTSNDEEAASGSEAKPFDILIVGSGYGGAVAAAQFAGAKWHGKPLSVCMLERGVEYLEGMFPGAADELPGHLRFNTSRIARPMGKLEGLFDLRFGPDLNALVANGLGGGSLINAGVMLPPGKAVLKHPALLGVDAYFDEALRLLGANAYPKDDAPLKAKEFAHLAHEHPEKYQTVAITVGMPEGVAGTGRLKTSSNVTLKNCLECGDCATGCNFGAKNSLDLGLIVKAAHNGAAIYTGATVMRIERATIGGWIVHTVPTDRQLRNRHGEPLEIHARRLILAAGTFGSTEILLRSRTDKLRFSDQLGRNFSGNGDMLAVVHGQKKIVRAIADEGRPPRDGRQIGPSITSMIDLRAPDDTSGFAIQELAVPGPLRRVFEEVFTTALTLDRLGEGDETIHKRSNDGTDPCSVDVDAMEATTIVAMMGDDKAEGALELIGDANEAWGDGAILVRWPQLRGGSGKTPNDSLYDQQMRKLEKLVKASPRHGRVLANPVWRMLPSKLSFLMDEMRGPPLTVHPLGGCAMGADRKLGVVNRDGQVFDASQHMEDVVFEDLVVLDGSIVPRALGINPALTITALALRATQSLRKTWGLDVEPKASEQGPPELPKRTRPIFQEKRYAAKPASDVSIVERLGGWITFALPGEKEAKEWFVELTVRYVRKPLPRFMGKLHREVEVDKDESFFRIFDRKTYESCSLPQPHSAQTVEERLEDNARLKGKITGKLEFFHREDSTPGERRWRGLVGYIRNRGVRDFVDYYRNRIRELGTKEGSADSMTDRISGAWALSSRAGEVRRFDYALCCVNNPLLKIEGCKRLTYGYRANLWQQLETLELSTLLGVPVEGELRVDLTYFSTNNTPLLRIEKQHNLVTTLMDLTSFGALVTRIMINIHVWSFRRPDEQKPRGPQRLPGIIERPWWRQFLKLRMPPPRPRIHEIVVDRKPDATPVMVRLTRYARFDSAAKANNPVLLIHGYSASGTTFAHTAVRPNITEKLWHAGRDVWIVDLRTSAGMPTATDPWSFEDAALVDIPAAIEFILRDTGASKVDVVAHCMGAAMLSMAVLKEPERGDPLFDVRAKLPGLLGRVVLSQVGPVVQFTPINVLRADVLKYIRRFIAGATYDFRVKDSPSLAEQLLDRFLSSLRYPKEELEIENPLIGRTRFAGTRHRIDALYGRAFSLANMSREVLGKIDDFFGPLSLETVSQGMHLAKETVITDRRGRNVFLTRKTRDERWTFPTLTIHGGDNGMIDPVTQVRIDNYFNYSEGDSTRRLARPRVEQEVFEGTGHQDTFIGKASTTRPVFRRIIDFLDCEGAAPKPVANKLWLIDKPWIGPNRGPAIAGQATLRLGAATNRRYGDALLAVCVAVERVGEHYEPVEVDVGYGRKDSTYVFTAKCDQDGWLSVDVSPNLLAKAKGFLFLLVYDQPAGMDGVQLAQFAEFRTALERATPNFAIPVTFQALANIQLMQSQGTINLNIAFLQIIQDLARVLGNIPVGEIKEQVRKDLAKHPATKYDPAYIETTHPGSAGKTALAQIFVSSCQYPHGLMDARPAWSSFERLGVAVKEHADIPRENKLLLLVGDQIYSDATAGFADPTFPEERYRRPHETLFSRKEVKAVLREVPSVMMLDDHEIADNWEPTCDDPRPRDSSRPGIDAYKDFQRRAGPPFHTPCDGSPDPLWFKHAIGNVNLFVADTRTERRVRRAVSSERARIMSPCQQRELFEWLWTMQNDPATADAPKLVASPSILLPRKIEMEMLSLEGAAVPQRMGRATSLRYDSWLGYPWSTGALLDHIVQNGVRNVIFLSGDEHLFCLAKARITANDGKSALIHSIHCSPMYAPLPFANATAAEFPEVDSFVFTAPETRTDYSCIAWSEVQKDVRSGFTEILAGLDQGQWVVKVRFQDGNESTSAPWRTLTNKDGVD